MSFETQIEFDKIKNIWADLALTEAAKEQIAAADIKSRIMSPC